MSKKLFTKVVSLSLTAAMVLSMAPVNASAAKAVKPKSMKAPKASKIKVGQTKTITASRKSKKSTNDVKYVNFKPAKTKNIGIGVKTSDDTIVSVEKVSNGKYTYTGVTTGTATLTITSRAKTAKGKKLQAKLDVTVINPFRVTQTGAYTFTMSTADKLEKAPEKKDIMVKQEGSAIDNAVKEVKLSEDKMSVEVTMHVPFVDQKKYEVTFGKEKDSFVASVGAPAAINIKTQTAVVNKATEVEFAILDAKGMDVTKVLDEAKITKNVTVTNGFYDTKKNEVTLFKVGDKAEATVTYHTWTYDQTTGKEIVVSGKGTITAVDKSSITVVGIDKYTVADTVLSWDTDEMKAVMPEKQSKSIFVRMKKSDGTYVDNLGKEKNNFKFSATNSPIITVDENGTIFGFRQGAAYVKVVYTDFNVKYEYTLPVTISAPSVASSIHVFPNYVTVSKDAATPDTQVIVQVKDQYGEVLKINPTSVVNDHLSGAKVATISTISSLPTKNLKLGVKGNNTIGVGSYKLTYNPTGVNLNTTLTVNAIEVGARVPVRYMLKAVDTTEMDTTIVPNTNKDDIDELVKNGIKFRLYAIQNNVITGDAAKVLDKNLIHTPTEKRHASVSVTRAGAIDTSSDGTVFAGHNSDILEINSDGNEFTIHPVIYDGTEKNVLLTHNTGTHTIKVSFWVKDDEDPTKFKKVELSAQYTITNNTKDGIEGEGNDYKIEKKIALAEKNAVKMAKAVVIPQKASPLTDGTWEKDTFFVVATGTGAWYNKNPKNDPGNNPMSLDYKYNLDTAPIPTYKTAKDTIQVWTLKDKIAKDIEITDAGVVSNITLEPVASAMNKTKVTFTAADYTNATKGQNRIFWRVKADATDLAKVDDVITVGTGVDKWHLVSSAVDTLSDGTNVTNKAKIEFVVADVVSKKVTGLLGLYDAKVKLVNTIAFTAAAPALPGGGVESKDLVAAPKNYTLSITVVGDGLTKEYLETLANWAVPEGFTLTAATVNGAVADLGTTVSLAVTANKVDEMNTSFATTNLSEKVTLKNNVGADVQGAVTDLKIVDKLGPAIKTIEIDSEKKVITVTFTEETNLATLNNEVGIGKTHIVITSLSGGVTAVTSALAVDKRILTITASDHAFAATDTLELKNQLEDTAGNQAKEKTYTLTENNGALIFQ